jgi:iron complex transport system ATP-binding protein
MAVLSLKDVSFRYERAAKPKSAAPPPSLILDRVSMELAPGELVCVIGPNGAGKTTLLRLAAGLLPPAAGTVTLEGKDPRGLPRRELARRLAYLPQDYHLVFPFSVGEVVLMGRYPHRGALAFEGDADLAAAQEALVRCDVAHLAERRWDELSGGERRRALLAQAFCQAAPFVLLDEPTASLDPAHAVAVFRILVEEKRARAAAALVVTHDLNLTARFADRVLLVDGGHIVAAGPPAQVLASPEATRAFGVAFHVGALPGGEAFVVPT